MRSAAQSSSVALTLLITILAAGCLEGYPTEVPGPTDSTNVIRQDGIENGIFFIVDVTRGEGPLASAVPNALVAFFTKYSPDSPEESGYYHDVEDQCGSLNLDQEPFWVLAAGRTDENGRIIGELNPRVLHPGASFVPINVAVGAVPGFTTEGYVWTVGGIEAACGLQPLNDRVVVLPDGSNYLNIPVYPKNFPINLRGSLGPTLSGPMDPLGPVWFPLWIEPDSLSVERLWGASIYDRIERIEARLTWSNGVRGWSDLYLGFGPDGPEPAVIGDDEPQGPLDSGNVETIDAPVDADVFAQLAIGPVTDQPVIGENLPYHIEGMLVLRGITLRLP